MNRFQSGSEYERGNQWKPARERETTAIFSFRESILNHLHDVVGAVRSGVRCVEVGEAGISKFEAREDVKQRLGFYRLTAGYLSDLPLLLS
jgi:hypothetical protein